MRGFRQAQINNTQAPLNQHRTSGETFNAAANYKKQRTQEIKAAGI